MSSITSFRPIFLSWHSDVPIPHGVPMTGTQRYTLFSFHHMYRTDMNVDYRILTCSLQVSHQHLLDIPMAGWHCGYLMVTFFSSSAQSCLRTTNLFSVTVGQGTATNSYRNTRCPLASKTLWISCWLRSRECFPLASVNWTWTGRWETSFSLISCGCLLYNKVNWPFCLVIHCLDCPTLSQTKYFSFYYHIELVQTAICAQNYCSLGKKE